MQGAKRRWLEAQQDLSTVGRRAGKTQGVTIVGDVRLVAFTHPQAKKIGLNRVIALGMEGPACAHGWEQASRG